MIEKTTNFYRKVATLWWQINRYYCIAIWRENFVKNIGSFIFVIWLMNEKMHFKYVNQHHTNDVISRKNIAFFYLGIFLKCHFGYKWRHTMYVHTPYWTKIKAVVTCDVTAHQSSWIEVYESWYLSRKSSNQ